MKKVLLAMLFVALSAPVFTACNDDDDNEKNPKNISVKASGITSADAVKKVTAVYESAIDTRSDLKSGSSESASGSVIKNEITTVDFKDGGFTLELPGKVDASKLKTITKANMKLQEGITMSVESYKGVSVEFAAYNDKSEEVGYFYLSDFDYDNEKNSIDVEYLYSDTAFKITGKGTGKEKVGDDEAEINAEYNWNVSIAKGWNKVYFKSELIPAEGENEEYIKYTTQTTELTGIKWFFYSTTTPAEPAK